MTNKIFTKIIIFLLLVILLGGCSLFVRKDISRELKLIHHLEKWERFQLEGIAEISIDQFRLRKNVLINKNTESLNIALLDSGIFGLRPTPFLSIDIDTLFSISLPVGITDLAFDMPENDDFLTIGMINELFSTLKNNKTIIVRDGKLMLKQTEFIFNKDMQISHIHVTEEDTELMIRFYYRRSADLDRIDFLVDGIKMLDIQVDRIRYN